MEENDKKNMMIKSLNTKSNYVLILTEDCFLLLEKVDSWNGKIVFWSSLFSIKFKVESQKLIKGQVLNRLSEKEIRSMKINDIEKNTKELNDRILKGEINDYTVNTFTTLCGKAIEHFSMIGNEKYMEYMEMMKNVLKLEAVDKLTKENENEIKENAGK